MSENSYISQEEIEAQKAKEKPVAKKPASSSKKSASIAQILSGDFLNKEFFLNNLTFIFFVMFLLLLILGKNYYGKELSKSINETQLELDEMNADYVEAKANLEEETRRYKLREKLEHKGLKETVNETKIIRLKAK